LDTPKLHRRIVPAITALLGVVGGAALMRRTSAAPVVLRDGTVPHGTVPDGTGAGRPVPGKASADEAPPNGTGEAGSAGYGPAAGQASPGPPGATTPEGAEAPSPPSAEAQAHGFETKEMDVKLVVRILAGWGATAIAAVCILFWMLHTFHRTDARNQTPLTPQQSAAIVPPGPQLQGDPYRDLHALYDGQQAELMSYGWADPAHEKAHIPIARAMTIVTGRSLEPSP